MLWPGNPLLVNPIRIPVTVNGAILTGETKSPQYTKVLLIHTLTMLIQNLEAPGSSHLPILASRPTQLHKVLVVQFLTLAAVTVTLNAEKGSIPSGFSRALVNSAQFLGSEGPRTTSSIERTEIRVRFAALGIIANQHPRSVSRWASPVSLSPRHRSMLVSRSKGRSGVDAG